MPGILGYLSEGNILGFLYIIVNIIFAVTVHEFTHLRVASKFGDDTGEREGRLNLNPANHLDPIGSLLFLFSGFGWGRPAPIDYYKLRNPEKSFMLSALAGPLSNFLIAITFTLTAKFLLISDLGSEIVLNFLIIGIYINLGLMVFNLIPVPPLDGSRLIRYIMRNNYEFIRNRSFLETQFIFIIAIFIIFGGTIGSLISVIASYFLRFLQ